MQLFRKKAGFHPGMPDSLRLFEIVIICSLFLSLNQSSFLGDVESGVNAMLTKIFLPSSSIDQALLYLP